MEQGCPDGVSQSPKMSRKPQYNKFTQQELQACKPIITPRVVIVSFMLLAVIFIPMGLTSLFVSQNVVEIGKRYDNECIPQAALYSFDTYFFNPNTSKTCTKYLKVPKKMKSPIYVYYEIQNYYQNHRRYVLSKNENQLSKASSKSDTEGCSPKAHFNGSPIVPCGLIAWSLFNDTYAISVNNHTLQINKTGIAWKSDREGKFGSDVYPENFQKGTPDMIGGAQLNESIPLSQQEDLMVWMRPAALSNFRKLYGRLDVDLEADDIMTVTIENNYNTYKFNGKKSIVFSTSSWFGGKNEVVGIFYLMIGGCSLFLASCFVVMYFLKPRKIGDPAYLSWNKHSAGHVN